MKTESKYYIATIQWQDNKNIQDEMILKIGDIEEDDDEVFFYLEDDSEIEEYKKNGAHEWKIIDICELKTRPKNLHKQNNKIKFEYYEHNNII